MTGYQSKRAAAQDKLKQPAQEPVSWAVVGDGKFGKYELGQVFVDYEATHIYWKNRGYELVPVYTTPPQRPWVDLTDEDVAEVERWVEFKEEGSGRIPIGKLVAYINNKLKGKNT